MNKAKVLGGVVVFALAGSAQGAFVSLGTFGGHDYYYNDTSLNYTVARTAALNFDPGFSTLVAINDAAEQAQLNIWIPHIPNIGPVYWIGLNAEANPGGGIGAFNTWETAELVTYTNWAGDAVFNDPNFIYTSGNWNVGGVWNNLANNGLGGGKPSIVEVTRIIPAPGAAGALVLAGILAGARRRR